MPKHVPSRRLNNKPQHALSKPNSKLSNVPLKSPDNNSRKGQSRLLKTNPRHKGSHRGSKQHLCGMCPVGWWLAYPPLQHP